jgi:hypothetical protein
MPLPTKFGPVDPGTYCGEPVKTTLRTASGDVDFLQIQCQLTFRMNETGEWEPMEGETKSLLLFVFMDNDNPENAAKIPAILKALEFNGDLDAPKCMVPSVSLTTSINLKTGKNETHLTDFPPVRREDKAAFKADHKAMLQAKMALWGLDKAAKAPAPPPKPATPF